MVYCKFCGGQVPDGLHNCPHCGGVVDGSAPDGNNSFQQTQTQTQNTSYMGADNTSCFDNNELTTNQWCYALAYLWILFFLPLVVCPDSKTGRFHANQGLLLFIFTTACEVVASLLGFFGAIPLLGFVFGMLSGIIGWAAGVIHLIAFIYQLVNIINGKAVELPIIGKYRLIK